MGKRGGLLWSCAWKKRVLGEEEAGRRLDAWWATRQQDA